MVIEIDIESYKINKQKLFDLLKSIKNPGLKKHDMLKNMISDFGTGQDDDVSNVVGLVRGWDQNH